MYSYCQLYGTVIFVYHLLIAGSPNNSLFLESAASENQGNKDKLKVNCRKWCTDCMKYGVMQKDCFSFFFSSNRNTKDLVQETASRVVKVLVNKDLRY